MEENLFERIGGENGIAKVAEEFLKRATDDPRIRNRFNGFDLDELKRNSTSFIAGLVKSTQPYVSGPLAESFRGKGITKHEFNLAISLCEDALKEQTFSNHTIQQFLEVLGSVRVDIEGL
jgi:hemoglobin